MGTDFRKKLIFVLLYGICLQLINAGHYIKHVAGPFTDKIQRCVICGEVINDYTNARWPAGQPAPTGFPEGDLYITDKGNPKTYTQTIDEFDTFDNCN